MSLVAFSSPKKTSSGPMYKIIRLKFFLKTLKMFLLKGQSSYRIFYWPFNLVELVKKTIEDMVAIHGDRFNFINQECIDGFWDQKGIRRIIENLCNNAIKYGEHTKKVSVSLLQNKDTVQLEVQNYGELISEVDQKTLFEQFHRSESAQKSNKNSSPWSRRGPWRKYCC
jgi:signal transduction histidine kinase